jgi:ATP-dependent Zn protease
MSKSIVLLSTETTGKYVLQYIFDFLKLDNGIYLISDKVDNRTYQEKGNKKILPIIIPTNGTYKIDNIAIKINDLVLKIDDKPETINISDKEFEIIKEVTLYNDDIDVIKNFIQNCYTARVKFLEQNVKYSNKIKKKTMGTYGWHNDIYIPKRNLDTIFLKKNQAENIRNKLNKFIDPATYNDYIKHGIPYKYNILLHGKPGTGKTSLIHALASECNATISILNINSDLKETKLLDSFRNINDSEDLCIVVIEDIDCIFTNRKENDSLRNNITMQGLLNCMDGFNNQEGLILILTTNHPELLDSAITRSGRLDLNIELTYLDKYQATNMFKSFFTDESDNETFEKIWEVIKNKQIPPCMFIEFLFNNRDEDDVFSKLNELLKLIDKTDISLYT